MVKISEYQLNCIVTEIDLLVKTVKEKLLPPFEDSVLEQEANLIFKHYSGHSYQGAENEAASYYCDMKQSKADILNLSATWLYHLFEKKSSDLLKNSAFKEMTNLLKLLNIGIEENSDFYEIKTVLLEINNIIKHGKESNAVSRLYGKKPSLFETTSPRNTFNGSVKDGEYILKDFELSDLEHYSEKMKSFWNEIYRATKKPAN